MTEATPTPMPPTMRNSTTIHTLVREAGADGADQEQHRSDLHDRDAADLVGDPAGRHRARRRTQERRGDGETEFGVADAEILLDRRRPHR